MTKAQKAERDFWLGCAERADAQARGERWGVFLCCDADCSGIPGLRRKVEKWFPPIRRGLQVRWMAGAESAWKETDEHDRPSNRVLAACFLAAMAELGE